MRRQTKHLQETDVALFKSRGRVSMLEIRLRFKIRLRGIKWEGKCKCCPDPTYSASDEDEVGEAVFEIPVLFQNHQQCQSSFCSQVSSKHCIAVWNITLSGMCAIKWEWSFKGKLLSSVVRALSKKDAYERELFDSQFILLHFIWPILPSSSTIDVRVTSFYTKCDLYQFLLSRWGVEIRRISSLRVLIWSGK